MAGERRAVELRRRDAGVPVPAAGDDLGNVYVRRWGGEHWTVEQALWSYVDGETLTLDGANAQDLTIPARANVIEMRARDGRLTFNINAVADADINSPGFIPENGGEILAATNLDNVSVFSDAANTVAHVLYWEA